jgi:dihydrolipoamide dehydrogenase
VSAPSSPADLVILGGGSGGYAAALRAAELGMSVVLIERDKVGGTCLHRGCIPTKALLHAGEVADLAREGEQFGVKTSLAGIDMDGVNSYKDGVVGRLYKGLQGLIKSKKINYVEGEGRLASPTSVEVNGQTYEGRHILLATGSYARSLPGLEIDGTRVITSDHALTLAQLPSSAIVLGGGVIGVEFASAWRSLGVEVTVVEVLPRLVPSEDPAISAALERAFRRRKIGMRTGSAVKSCTSRDDGVIVGLEDGVELAADLALVAVGRGPHSAGLGYAEAGVGLDRGFATADQRLRTSVPGIYAVGDLVAGAQLAHRGFAQGIFVAEDIGHRTGRLPSAPQPVNEAEIPRVTYCDPEIASVGLAEEAANIQYGDIETRTYDLAGNGKSQILKTSGFVKIVRRRHGPVVGVHMIGSRVSELSGEAQLITGWEAFPSDVAPYVHAHPTQSEALGEAHLALAGKPLHTHS